MSQILVVDDEELFLIQIQEVLQKDGHEVYTARSGMDALDRFRVGGFDLVITDLKMPGMDGLQLLQEIRNHSPKLPVIMMSGQGTIDLAVSAIKEGSSDFLVKPFSWEHLSVVVKRVLYHQKIEEENIHLREQIGGRLSFHNLIGKNHKMQKIYDTLSIVAPSDSTVVILGETGTGKDLIAQAIHYNSLRKDKPFVKVDCGILTENLLESELFGHEKGAFTNAYQRRIGRFEYANGGTIFMDEIGEMPLSLQVKLLRVIEEKRFERLGSNRTIEVEVRIIAATNRDLSEDVKKGNFRRDLFYRLNVIQVGLPPLRERVDDIPLLVQHFLKLYAKKLGRKKPRLAPGVLRSLVCYPWPGNVRELENVIEKTLTLSNEEVIESIDLPENGDFSHQKNGKIYLDMPFKSAKKNVVEEFERDYFLHILEWSGGNISMASKRSEMDYKSFYEKMKLYGIEPDIFKKRA